MFNRVSINCFDKTVIFPEIEEGKSLFLSARQVNEAVADGAELFMLLATLEAKDALMSPFAIVPVLWDINCVFKR